MSTLKDLRYCIDLLDDGRTTARELKEKAEFIFGSSSRLTSKLERIEDLLYTTQQELLALAVREGARRAQ